MFTTERQLVIKLKSNFSPICNWTSNKLNTEVLEEVNLGYGIADLVITKIKKEKKTKNSLGYFDILVYKIIESGIKVSISKIKEITKANEFTIKKSLNKLIVDCYINQQDGYYQFKKSYDLIASDSIAIEAKLKNWKRALNQAYRYKWFASQSYVVLDSNYINPALANLEDFRKYNVGLAEICNSGILKIHHRPTSEKPIDDKMFILLNEQIRLNLLSKQV
ncbi:MAG: hypothetical protein JO154_04585 [Chitinophaga sp.]|uniref:hypothetical protein n=1 Tax=Chitinophaga sp. TaxID=1869181 RepID=UPI0025BD0B34|nr:hypothetical protein [Chitinophaga sp.]MBV8251864.1 hypothetical protein [Chitinophaga sp.]